MKSRLALAFLLITLLLPAQATAQQIDPEKEADIRRLMELSGGQKMLDNVFATMFRELGQMMQERRPPGEKRQKAEEMMIIMREKMLARMQYDELVKRMLPLYDKFFTHQDIKDLIQFYETPLGQHTLRVMPRLAEESVKVGVQWGREIIDEVMEEMAEEFPELREAQLAANEAEVVAVLRVVNTACVAYSSTHPEEGYPASLSDLGPEGDDLVDAAIASGTRNGYLFEYLARDTNRDGILDVYEVRASPVAPGKSGKRYFFTDETGVIRQSEEGPATATSPPVA